MAKTPKTKSASLTDPDHSIYEHLAAAGLKVQNIVLLNPISLEVCINDESFLKGMPAEYNGKPITYVYLTEKERSEIYAFRSTMDAEHVRRKQGYNG